MGALALAARYWKYGVMALLLVALIVQTGRVDSWRDRARAEKSAHAETVANVRAAQEQAKAAQLAAIQAVEARYRALAQKGDTDVQTNRQAAQDASDRLIRNGPRCVRAEAVAGQPGNPDPAAGDRGADVHPGVSADSFLAISELDVRACGDATAYAIAAHQWAMSLRDGAP